MNHDHIILVDKAERIPKKNVPSLLLQALPEAELMAIPQLMDIPAEIEKYTHSVFYLLLEKQGVFKADYAAQIKAGFPNSFVVCICAGSCFFNMEEAFVNQADGFLSLSSPNFKTEFQECLQSIKKGERYFKFFIQNEESVWNKFSVLQWFIIRYTASGLKQNEMADILSISVADIKYHIKVVKENLGFETSTEIAAWATLQLARIERKKAINTGDPLWEYFKQNSKNYTKV